MFVPTLEDKGALKLFGNRFLNKCEGVCHFHSLPLQFFFLKKKEKRKKMDIKKWIEKKEYNKKKKNKAK